MWSLGGIASIGDKVWRRLVKETSALVWVDDQSGYVWLRSFHVWPKCLESWPEPGHCSEEWFQFMLTTLNSCPQRVHAFDSQSFQKVEVTIVTIFFSQLVLSHMSGEVRRMFYEYPVYFLEMTTF